MTQDSLGEMIGKNQKQVWEYEAGRTKPKYDVIVAMAQALDTTTDWLLGLTDYPERPLRGLADLDEDERTMLELLRAQKKEVRKSLVAALKALAS